MLKRLALALAVLAVWLPAQVFALGLGNIDMKSALNQPLSARIELLRARDGELKDLTVALASADTFRRAGIERPAFLTQLKFEVVSNPGGNPYIQVSSAQPITEPFLNFLIEVNWPNGRLLREFTVLVDPPVVTDTPPVAVTAPSAKTGSDPIAFIVDEVAAERARVEGAAGAPGELTPSASAPTSGAPEPATEAPAVAETPAAGGIDMSAAPSTSRAEAERDFAPVTRPSAPEPEPAPAVEDTTASETIAEAPPAEAAAPKPRPAPKRRAKPEPAAEPEPAGRDEATADSGEGLNYGPVKSNETLWEIAMKMRPNKKMSVPQLMIALLENNPEAFVDNNINNLKRGAVLRLSDPGAAMSVSKEEAMRIADLQWEQWKQQRGSMVGSTMSRRGAPPAQVAPADARVKLVAPDSDTTGSEAPGAAASAGSSTAARLRNELSVAQEKLDSQRQETQDMRDRVAGLEEQLSTMKRLIQMKDDQLAAIQTQSKAPAAAAVPEAAAPTAASAENVAANDPKAAETPDAQKDATAAAAKPATKPATKPKAGETQKSTGLLAGLMNDPKLIGLAGVIVGLVVLVTWLYVRRRKMQQFQESILTLDLSSSAGSSADAKADGDDASFMSDFAVSSMAGIQTDFNEVDPLSEADVYLAYGRHKQAEELVAQAIQKDPQRAELKMKLMEIHYAGKEKDAFVKQAKSIQAEFSSQQPEMWSRIVEMGHELAPDNSMFGGAGGDSALGGADVGGGAGAEEFDLGDLNMGDSSPTPAADEISLDFDAGNDAPKAEATAESSTGDALDFDLGDFKFGSNTEEETKAEAPAETGDSGHSLDFDLSSFDKTEPEPAAAAADSNALDFDLGSFGQSNQKEEETAVEETVAAASSDDGGLDFKLDDEPIAAAPTKSKRDDNVVDFSRAASTAKTDLDTALDDREINGELDDALFADVDEVGTKLDLAKAYIDMGDSEGARSILDEVMEEGDDTQKQEAQVLMRQIG